jgi:hypothetical protein
MGTGSTIRGRLVTAAEVEFIREVVRKHWDRGRSFISRVICEEWAWVQTNGQLKEMACREMLRVLAARGEVVLPPGRGVGREKGSAVRGVTQPTLGLNPRAIEGMLQELLPVQVRMVRGTVQERQYRQLVEEHHYLGYRQIVGEHLKYMAFSGNRPLACIGWGAAAWKVAGRDEYIGWTAEVRKQRLQWVANNTRFLILPWVRVPHLASFLLGQQARVIAGDWEKFYGHPVVLLETFVDKSRFKGTCYRAANWVWVGETKGRGKYDRQHERTEPVRDVYVYPLRRDFRGFLTEEGKE